MRKQEYTSGRAWSSQRASGIKVHGFYLVGCDLCSWGVLIHITKLVFVYVSRSFTKVSLLAVLGTSWVRHVLSINWRLRSLSQRLYFWEHFFELPLHFLFALFASHSCSCKVRGLSGGDFETLQSNKCETWLGAHLFSSSNLLKAWTSLAILSLVPFRFGWPLFHDRVYSFCYISRLERSHAGDLLWALLVFTPFDSWMLRFCTVTGYWLKGLFSANSLLWWVVKFISSAKSPFIILCFPT